MISTMGQVMSSQVRILRTLPQAVKTIITPYIRSGAWYSHSDCVLLSKLGSKDKEDRRFTAELQNYSRQILEEQLLMNWEGLAKEAKELCIQLGLPDVSKKDIHREDIKSAVMYHNIKKLKEEMGPLKKLEMIKYINFRKMAPFMKEKSLEDSRLEFLWLTDMLDSRSTMSKKYSSPYCPHCVAGQVLGGCGVSTALAQL